MGQHTDRLVRRHLALLCALFFLATSAPVVAGPTFGGLSSLGNFAVPAPGGISRFGYALASGDFNGDGDMDLAVGLPNDATNGAGAGAVYVYVFQNGVPQLTRDYNGPAGSNTGWSLAAGDFDGNGLDEIAVGRISETVGGAAGAGRVAILGWNPSGFQLLELATFAQGQELLGDTPENSDSFGRTLAVGDFNADSRADLAIGVPFEDLPGGAVNQGIVQVLYGFASGLSTLGSQTWSQDTNFILGVSENQDSFGYALATGDFDGDGRDDLAVGVPNEPRGATPQVGAVAVLYGSTSAGLAAGGNELWFEGTGSIPGTGQELDQMGLALVAGRFTNDGFDDLVIGVPGDDVGALTNAGAVFELHGSAAGLTATGFQRLTLANLGGAIGDGFGTTLAGGDFDGDHLDDLAVGSPWVTIGGKSNAGMLDVFPAAGGDLSTARHAHWTANGLAAGPPQVGDAFGLSLAAGDLGDDGRSDLFIGLPNRSAGSPPFWVGGLQVLRGRAGIFADDFEAGNAAGWATLP
jgi:hypothetical protein